MQNDSHGREKKIATLLLRHHGFVFRHARHFVLFPDLAEDVVQQVFIEILSRQEQWDIDQDIRPLLFVITRRTAQKLLKEQTQLFPETLLEISRLIQSRQNLNFHDSQTEDRVPVLKDCLQNLSSQGRKLIEDYYYEGVTTEILARRLRKKPNSVIQAIGRLREKLRACIEFSLKTSKELNND